eukprot:CAMPEP_0119465996 /NCGR_PEP_ID=MMETSP1344-20130328/860_1 /TAXON_ID=236787 /ORGANISM="Florenciella parvula, Strain CCMP2471" /LENGTH=116 /DNA_ID=CAMNT_0007498285 /DNA_START=121 /DNA_END=468 /DNA_ORIENTATION=+
MREDGENLFIRQRSEEDGNDFDESQGKEWRSTALRARVKQKSPIFGMIGLVIFVVTVVVMAGMADSRAEQKKRLLADPASRPLPGGAGQPQRTAAEALAALDQDSLNHAKEVGGHG